jgi:hypothetical protein
MFSSILCPKPQPPYPTLLYGTMFKRVYKNWTDVSDSSYLYQASITFYFKGSHFQISLSLMAIYEDLFCSVILLPCISNWGYVLSIEYLKKCNWNIIFMIFISVIGVPFV